MTQVNTFPSAVAVASGTHTIATLTGFQAQRDACLSLLNNNLINGPQSPADAKQLWEHTQKQCQLPPKHRDADSPRILSLPTSLQQFEQELKLRPAYRRGYDQAVDYQLVLVPLCHLITPQWYVDLDDIESLKEHAPLPGDLEGALTFCFKDEIVPDPTITQINTPGGQGYIFTFPRCHGLPGGHTWAFEPADLLDPARRNFSIALHTKGNYAQVAQIQEALVVVNGTHRLSALFAAGWEYAPALLRSATSLSDCGFPLNDHGIHCEPQTLARPPFLCDFFDEGVSPRFQRVCVDTTLQMIVQFNTNTAPRLNKPE